MSLKLISGISQSVQRLGYRIGDRGIGVRFPAGFETFLDISLREM
jgi:hypothetical protein